MTHSRRALSIVAVAALAAGGGLMPRAAEAHPPSGFRGRPVIVGGGFYGSPYWGPFGFAPYYWGGSPFGPPGGLDPNIAAVAGLGAIDVQAKPNRAEVWVDGGYIGEARDLDGYPSYLWLKEGTHRVAVFKGGFAVFEQDVEVRRGLKTDLKVELEKGASEPPGRKPGESK
jgi:PEGA domain